MAQVKLRKRLGDLLVEENVISQRSSRYRARLTKINRPKAR